MSGGVEVKSEAKLSALHVKVVQGHRTAIRKLLREDAIQVDSRNESNETPLHLAARTGDAVVCELLIKAGANLYASRVDGMTPLHIATTNDHLDCVAILLRYGSNPRLRDQLGRYSVDLIRSPEMAQCYLEFFTNVRKNPSMLSLVEKTLLWKDIDDILSYAYREMELGMAKDTC
jgi:ankyrin repeat protein